MKINIKLMRILITLFAFFIFVIIQIAAGKFQKSLEQDQESSSVKADLNYVFKNGPLMTIEDREIVQADLDAPILILKFWSSWCTPCIKELKLLNEVRRSYSEEEVAIMAVVAEGESREEDIKKILGREKITFPVILDGDGRLFERFNIKKVPYVILFKSGEIIRKDIKLKDILLVDLKRL